MSYKTVLKKSAAKELDAIPTKQRVRIIEHLKQLVENPRLSGSEKLKGREEYKLRVGSFRIIYDIDDKQRQITIYLVEDRKQVYKKLKRK
jgi:mRNA interferase RelE/StbE